MLTTASDSITVSGSVATGGKYTDQTVMLYQVLIQGGLKWWLATSLFSSNSNSNFVCDSCKSPKPVPVAMGAGLANTNNEWRIQQSNSIPFFFWCVKSSASWLWDRLHLANYHCHMCDLRAQLHGYLIPLAIRAHTVGVTLLRIIALDTKSTVDREIFNCRNFWVVLFPDPLLSR